MIPIGGLIRSFTKTIYQTEDGKEFESLSLAKKHQATCELQKIVDEGTPFKYSRDTCEEIVIALINKAADVSNIMNTIMNNKEEAN